MYINMIVCYIKTTLYINLLFANVIESIQIIFFVYIRNKINLFRYNQGKTNKTVQLILNNKLKVFWYKFKGGLKINTKFMSRYIQTRSIYVLNNLRLWKFFGDIYLTNRKICLWIFNIKKKI